MSFKDIDKWPKIKMFLFCQISSWECLFNTKISIVYRDLFRKYHQEQIEKKRREIIKNMFNYYK